MIGKANGVLTYSTDGVPHLEIERRHAEALMSEYRRGLRDGKKQARTDLQPLPYQDPSPVLLEMMDHLYGGKH
jgi:hypothetical protein